MKYIKTYESQHPYKVGDYIVAKFDVNADTSYLQKNAFFLKNNVGKIVSNNPYEKQGIRVKYEDKIPDASPVNNNTWYFMPDQIRFATPEEIEQHKIKLQQNKFNL